MNIRVLRILEYTYESAERMVEDIGHWQVAANGSYEAGRGLQIRSATLPPSMYQTAQQEQDFVEAVRDILLDPAETTKESA